MQWDDQPAMPVPLTPVRPAAAPGPVTPVAPSSTATSGGRTPGLKRTVLTAAVSAMLLVGGAVAVVNAASPDPSSAPSVTAPSGGGATTPSTKPNHTGANCPNMGTGGSSGSSGGTVLPNPAASPQT